MAAQTQPSAQQQRMTMQQQNNMIRQAILKQAVRLRQKIFSQAWVPTNQPTLNFSPNFIGLLRRFTVVITGTVTNNDAANAATLSDLGLAALLDPSQGIVLQDLNGYNRIQTGLWHLLMVESVKRAKLYGAKWTPASGTPWANSGNWGPIVQPTNLTVSGGATPSSTFRLQFDIPVSYMPDDLRGAIWVSVVNATMQTSLNFNQNLFVAAASDATFAMYYGTTDIALSNVQVTVYQDYLDQLPSGQNGQPALPMQDLSTVYELKKTQYQNIAQNVENPFPYTNLRRFLSTAAIFDSDPGGTATENRQAGGDVNYWALQTASQLYLWRLDPQMFAEMVRQQIGWDLPAGFYFFDHRRQPIYTPTYGNMQLLLNPITADTGALVTLGYEDFADINLLTQASGLPGGN